MKLKDLVLIVVAACGIFALSPTATAQGSAFTYQGRLESGGNPANGSYDIQFTLFATNTGGVAVAGPVTDAAMTVNNGLFTATVDFGDVFTGAEGWLQVEVSPHGSNVFETLTPRQQLTPVPYAIFANTAETLSGPITATNFLGSLAGDVTGAQSATVVAKVGGATAAHVASATAAANAASSANSTNTIVKRDSSGNFAAGTVTGSFVGDGSGLTNLTSPTSFTGSLSGDVTGTQGATVVAKVGGSTAAQVASGLAAASGATSANSAGAIVKRDSSGNFAAGTVTGSFTGNGGGLTNLNSTNITGTITATSFSGSFSGDVTGTQGATVVAKVGGSTAAQVASGLAAASGATSANSAGAIVKRDSSGNFAAGTVTGSFIGNGGGLTNLNSTNITGTITATSFSGSLSGDVTGTQGATVVAKVGGATAAQVASGLAAASGATSANTASAIVKRDASGNFAAGTITGSFSGNGANLTGVNAATLDGLSSAGFWSTNGNSGANPTNGAFLGTVDNQPLEMHVNGQRALRLEPAQTSPNVIGGSSANFMTNGAFGSFIGGGGDAFNPQSIADNFSAIAGGYNNEILQGGQNFIGGGAHNLIFAGGGFSAITGGNFNTNQGGDHAFIGGGKDNKIQDSPYAVISGGLENNILGAADQAVISGGEGNRVGESANHAAIGGGLENSAGGSESMIPGGRNNIANGQFSFAAGYGAQALNDGSFVWADSTGALFFSTAANQFLVHATGGFGINTNIPGTNALAVNGSAQIAGSLQVKGLVRQGSETGTSEAPNEPGLVTRRCNSSSDAAGQVVAVSDAGGVRMTLERDGTPGGFLVRFASAISAAVVTGTGIDRNGNAINVYKVYYGGTTGTDQVFNTSQFVGHFQLSFGDPFTAGPMTDVTLTRFVDSGGNDTVDWAGTLTSTINQ